jgi:hypothetical protein
MLENKSSEELHISLDCDNVFESWGWGYAWILSGKIYQLTLPGLFFPILVHELIKGTMEVLGTQGLPDDPKQAEMVMSSTDTLANEIWDLRLGPVIWEKFLTSYPERLFDEDKKFIQSYLFARFSALSADEFFNLAKMILRGDAKATSILDKMVTEIVNHLNEVHSNDDDDSSDYDSEDDNDVDGPDDLSDLDDFLGSLGIDRS